VTAFATDLCTNNSTTQARGIRNANIPTKARLTYFADQSLKLDLQYKKENEWTNCFDIPNFKVLPVSYLGFSAETGELSDNHDIITVKTYNLYKHNSGSNAAAAGGNEKAAKSGKTASSYKKPQAAESGGSWTWFFFKFLLFGLAVAGAYVGFTIYRTRQRDRF
jgi:mannose-binding lectin 2